MILLALLAIAASGAGLVAAGIAEPVADRADRALRIALAGALGIGTWSAAYAAARIAGVGVVAKDVILVLLGSALWLAARRPRAEATPSPRDPAPRYLWALFALGCVIAAAAFVEHNRRFPDGGWDAWLIWNMRARFLARAPDLDTVFSPVLSYRAHADYPWLVPGAVAQGAVLAGHESLVSKAIAAAFGVCALAIVPLALARLEGQRWGLLGALAIVSVPAFAVFVSNQQSDIPLAVFVGAGAALLAMACARPRMPPPMLVLAGFAAGLGAWTKNEGLLYAACLAAGLLWRTKDARATAAFVAGVAPGAALLVAFKLTYAQPNDLAHFSTAATIAGHLLDPLRWGELGLRLLRRIVFFQVFGLWLVAAIAAALVVRRIPGTPAGTAVWLALAALVLVYIVQPLALDWLVRTSADRLIMQLWPTAVLALLPALARTTART